MIHTCLYGKLECWPWQCDDLLPPRSHFQNRGCGKWREAKISNFPASSSLCHIYFCHIFFSYVFCHIFLSYIFLTLHWLEHTLHFVRHFARGIKIGHSARGSLMMASWNGNSFRAIFWTHVLTHEFAYRPTVLNIALPCIMYIHLLHKQFLIPITEPVIAWFLYGCTTRSQLMKLQALVVQYFDHWHNFHCAKM